MSDLSSLVVPVVLPAVGLLLVVLSFVFARGRNGPYVTLVALLVLAGLIWFGESLLMGVLGATIPADVTALNEHIVYDDGTQARHVFDVALRYTQGGRAVDETLAVNAASFDQLQIGSPADLRIAALGESVVLKRLGAQPLNTGVPPWQKFAAIGAVLLWSLLRLPRLRPLLLLAAALGVMAYVYASTPGAPSGVRQSSMAVVKAVQPVALNRGRNDEGAIYLFAIDDQLVLPEALVDGAFVELEFMPEGGRRPVIAVDAAKTTAVTVGDSVAVSYAPNAARAARGAISTRADIPASNNVWILGALALVILAGMEWLGRRLQAASVAIAAA